MPTYKQQGERLRGKTHNLILRTLREEGVYNELMWLDGKIDTVSADGKTADVFINGATTSTKAIPIVNGLKVVAGDEVIVLNRAKMRDLVIMYGKSTSSLSSQSWIAPTLLNAWVNWGGSFAPAGYLKDALGFVRLKGLLKSGTTTTNTVIFTLPVGYRPLDNEAYSVYSNDGALVGTTQVYSNGEVRIISGGNTSFSLCGITFRAER